MSDRVKQNVRYWGFLALKLALSCGIAAVFLCEINYSWTPRFPVPVINWRLFFWDGFYTLLVGLWFLFLVGLLYLSVLDQRYRCRVCLRRLRMPIERGSWSRMLQLGRPEMEYICIYGHGKLNVSELQITGMENPAWKEQGDIWSELFAGDPDKKA
ncbi:MAG TPA: hypothetical protein VGL72_22840 [Bryobacteraceae bacterium]|jgi:hypothetical protein